MSRCLKAVCSASLLAILSHLLLANADSIQLGRDRIVKPQPRTEPASAISAYLDKIAAELWLRSRSQIEFCFGNSQQQAEDLLRVSFAIPIPTGEGICSNAEEVETKLCEPDDMMFYYKVLYVTDIIARDESMSLHGHSSLLHLRSM